MSGDSMEATGETSSSIYPAVSDILGWGKYLAESGSSWQPYTGSTVTPYSDQTMQALDSAQSTATSAQPYLNQQVANVSGVANDGGLNTLQDQQVSQLQQMQGGTGLNSMQQQAYSALTPTTNGLNTEQQQALGWLQPIAGGSMMEGNPYLEDMIKKSADDIRYQTGLSASGMGRYGSGGHEGVLADSIADMTTGLRYQNYMDEAARRDAAINSYAGLGTTGAQQRTDALGQQFGMGSTGQQQVMDATTALYGIGQQQRDNVLGGTQALLDAYYASLAPSQTMLGVGQAYEDKYGQTLADQQRIFEESQAAQTAPLDWLAGLINPYATSTTTTSEASNPYSTGAGNYLTTYGLTGDPYLSLLGGLSGLL